MVKLDSTKKNEAIECFFLNLLFQVVMNNFGFGKNVPLIVCFFQIFVFNIYLRFSHVQRKHQQFVVN